MQTNIDVLIHEDDIRKKVKELAEKITQEYENEEIIVVGLLRGSVLFLGFPLHSLQAGM